MDALVEVHSESDVASAIRSGAKLIGINNRNLQTFHTDIATSMQLVSQLAPDQIPVAASGIQNRQDIERLLKSGIFNFLIGESLVRSKDPAAFLRNPDGIAVDNFRKIKPQTYGSRRKYFFVRILLFTQLDLYSKPMTFYRPEIKDLRPDTGG